MGRLLVCATGEGAHVLALLERIIKDYVLPLYGRLVRGRPLQLGCSHC